MSRIREEQRDRVLQGLETAHLDRERGRFTEARRRLGRILSGARASLGRRDPVLALVLNELGRLGKDEGRYPSAERSYREALDIVRRSPRSRRLLEMADLYHNLGGLEHARGRYSRGEPLARFAVRLRAVSDGPRATVTWTDRTAHAALLEGMGRLDECEATYREALRVFRRRLGPRHFEVAATLNNLGCVRAERGDFREAVRLLKRALAVKEHLFGRSHVEVAVTLANLSSVVAEHGDRDEARELLDRALKIFTMTLGPAHPNTRACLASARGGATSNSSRNRRPEGPPEEAIMKKPEKSEKTAKIKTSAVRDLSVKAKKAEAVKGGGKPTGMNHNQTLLLRSPR